MFPCKEGEKRESPTAFIRLFFRFECTLFLELVLHMAWGERSFIFPGGMWNAQHHWLEPCLFHVLGTHHTRWQHTAPLLLTALVVVALLSPASPHPHPPDVPLLPPYLPLGPENRNQQVVKPTMCAAFPPVSHRGRTAAPSPGPSLTLLMGTLDLPPPTQWNHTVHYPFLLDFSLWTASPQLLGKHAWAHGTHASVTWCHPVTLHTWPVWGISNKPQTSDQCIQNTLVHISKRQDFWKM